MTLERILLQTIKFDLQVEHPYQFLLKYAKCLKGDKAKLQKMVQMAWTFVNDSLCTTLCLQWEPEIIAVALMYLAGKLSKFEVVDWVGRNPKHLRWWDMFVEDVTMDLLEDICHQVSDFFLINFSSLHNLCRFWTYTLNLQLNHHHKALHSLVANRHPHHLSRRTATKKLTPPLKRLHPHPSTPEFPLLQMCHPFLIKHLLTLLHL